MLGPSKTSGKVDRWTRPAPVRYIGLAFLFGSALLIFGRAYRSQGNMIHTGLLFLSLGLLFSPGVFQKGWTSRILIGLLIVVGVGSAFLT